MKDHLFINNVPLHAKRIFAIEFLQDNVEYHIFMAQNAMRTFHQEYALLLNLHACRGSHRNAENPVTFKLSCYPLEADPKMPA